MARSLTGERAFAFLIHKFWFNRLPSWPISKSVQSAANMLTKQAQQLLEAAEAAQAGGQTLAHFTLLVHDDGSIQMLADCDWPLESLESHHGARAVYRVAEVKGKIQVEGRAGLRTCLLRSVSPLASASFVFATKGVSTRLLPT